MFEYMPPESPPVVYERVVAANKNDEVISLRLIAKRHLDTMSKQELDRNWKLHEFFGTIAVINLPKASERLQNVTAELHNIGTETFEIFPAIDGRADVDQSIWKKFYLNLHDINIHTQKGKIDFDRLHQGQAGCYLSHYRLIQKMKAAFEHAVGQLADAVKMHDIEAINRAEKEMLKCSRVLILEDDSSFGFLQDKTHQVLKKGAGVALRKALRDIPDDWDLLYFIVNPSEPTTEVTPYLQKLNRSWSLNAYAVNYSMYGPLLELLKKIEDPAITQVWPVDNEISELHSLYNVYAINPSIVYSAEGISYITGKKWKPWQGQPRYLKKRRVPTNLDGKH